MKNEKRLGDFTADAGVLAISAAAIGIGALSCLVALGLLRLIRWFTNIFFFQTLDMIERVPKDNHLGAWAVLAPVAGGIIVGLMARYGSDRIRGHGIPEAIEAILMNESRIQPRIAFLKPLASAICIGSGGPFGAEGPIIMTGGAFGSMAAQFLRLTSSERKTLLAAGAAGGMAAVFAAPLASVLLAVELLLFEWKPRSILPVALSSAVSAVLRYYLLGAPPLFPTETHTAFIGAWGFVLCTVAGLVAGALANGLTASVYYFEDAFHNIPIHWMWWPAVGGLVVGIGGLVFPEAMGVGYETIGQLLQGSVTWRVVFGILLVKWTIWAISLGSGTSGGVLAPLLMIGGALGGVEAGIFPDFGPGFWPMVSMAATLGGTMRAPLTAIIFALELTHEFNMMFPLMVAVFVAYGFTVLTMKRSILTEKISRRGYHLSCEYAIDPLELTKVREVMNTNAVVLSETTRIEDLADTLAKHERSSQRLFHVVDDKGRLLGVIGYGKLFHLMENSRWGSILDFMDSRPVTALPDEPLRLVAHRMGEHKLTRLPVLEDGKLIGIVSLPDLLQARTRAHREEHHRERILRLRFLERS